LAGVGWRLSGGIVWATRGAQRRDRAANLPAARRGEGRRTIFI
jgi:hypothetical protein